MNLAIVQQRFLQPRFPQPRLAAPFEGHRLFRLLAYKLDWLGVARLRSTELKYLKVEKNQGNITS